MKEPSAKSVTGKPDLRPLSANGTKHKITEVTVTFKALWIANPMRGIHHGNFLVTSNGELRRVAKAHAKPARIRSGQARPFENSAVHHISLILSYLRVETAGKLSRRRKLETRIQPHAR